VVLADGDRRERSAIASALRQAGYETIEVDTGLEALEAARADGIGLVVLEVALTGMTGYEVCHELRERGDDVPIFFVSSTRTEPLDRVAGLLIGADDYLAKPLEPAELVARIGRFVSRGRIARPRVENGDGAGLRLTEREREVLGLLAEGRTQKQIAGDLSISSRTVGTHIQKLLVKAGVHSRAELVAQAFRRGLVSLAPGRPASGEEPGAHDHGPRAVTSA
jgi:DNA-binding NarL/FixJ family response regulator